jgi:DNA-binding MarR family transcriptional regulator
MIQVSRNNLEAMESLRSLPTYTAGIAQASAYRLLKKFTEDCISEHDLTMMQWYIIGTVNDSDPEKGLSVGDLAALLDTGLPYITNTINTLESRGIVERRCCKDDSRIKRIYLCEQYASVVTEIEEEMRKRMRATLYKDITPKELLTYMKVLYKLNALLDSRS